MQTYIPVVTYAHENLFHASADGMVGNFQEQLKRLFSFFKNLNPRNTPFTKKQGNGNKRATGLTSKYDK